MTTIKKTIETDSSLNDYKIIVELKNEEEVVDYKKLNLSVISDSFIWELSQEGEKVITLNAFKEALKEQKIVANQISNNLIIVTKIRELNKMLIETGCKVSIFQTEDYYGEGDEDISEDDEYYGFPMFEAYIVDKEGSDIKNTTTGRFCCLTSVCEELEGYVLEIKASKEIDFDDSQYTFNEDIKSIVFDPECQSGMLENYGKDFAQLLKIVRKTPKRVWSVVDGEDDKVHVIAGMLLDVIHYVISNEDFREYGETYFYGSGE